MKTLSEQNRNSGNEKENVRSLEDEDSVRRSTKKKKDSHPTTGNEDGAGLGSYFPEGFKAGMSYRDSLLGELPGAYEQAFFGSAMEDDLVSSDEEDDPPEDGEVVISIPQFLKGGPWFIGEHFLSLRPWVPDFRPSEASVNTVAVWVRLPELPVEYYDKESLLLIGHALGPVLRVDFNTASAPTPSSSFNLRPQTSPDPKHLCIELPTIQMEPPTPRIEMAQAWQNIASSRDLQRLSRSPSPRRLSLASREQPVLELSLRSAENSRGQQCTEEALSTISGAKIVSISGGAKCVPEFSMIIKSSEMRGTSYRNMGNVAYQLSMRALKNVIWEMWPEMAWNAMEETGSLLPTTNPSFMSGNQIGLNVLTWNCRGVLNPCFRRALHDLLQINNPGILILTETRLGGPRAVDLAKSFPFDGFLCSQTIGFSGGIWILWKTNQSMRVLVGLNVGCFGKTFLLLLGYTLYLGHTFGNIFQRKKRVLARISGAQKALANQPSSSLVRLEKSLREEFNSILNLEEDFWALKSRRLKTLDAPLSIEEIKSSLWSLKPFKAPGPDGLHPGFFQRCWHIISDSVVKEVSHIFNCGRMPHYLNRTLISLIPKCPGPESLTQFRPISLCNTVYKIVTKAIVARIRPLLSNLISPFQAAFVPGRRAYDRLEWSFIREVLLFFHFPNHLISLIMDCVSSSTISILFNGGRMEEFSPSRGIRQGDPIIPLFVHLVKLTFPSPRVLFSPNVQPDVVSRLCRILGVSSTQDIGRYLGFPLRSNGRNTTDFNFIVEKVQAKLTSWKSKLLSPAGRVVLIQSVTSSLPAYYMQNTALPSSICNDLDRLNRNFLWGSTSESKKMHLVGFVTSLRGLAFGILARLSIVLPPPICAQIKSHYLCTLSHLEDCIVWDTVDGSFSLRKAYQLASKPSYTLDSLSSPTWLWHTLTSPRIQFFLWQCYHDSVPVRSTLAHRGINLNPSCPRCSCPMESLSHLFILRATFKWQTVFSFGLWNLWLRRNQVIFKPGTSFSNTPTSTLSFASEFFCLWGNGKNPKNSHSITIKWLLPPSGWAKLNTDGASSGNPGIAGGGGVLRDCRGAWVRGFSRHIDYASSVQAELRALLDGLLMTVELNIPYLEIEMDSLLAVDLILAVHPANAFLRSIVYDCS
uniref:RNase H type-1 domain-containing protein n=1 Tax=Fagus sylvatica TaxID=28930 RepID=A0A2N9HM73_FAGSY